MRFNNESDFPQPQNGQEYLHFPEGFDFIECFSAFTLIIPSKAHKWMYASIGNFMWLNPDLSRNEILKIVVSANSNRLESSLQESELESMIDTLSLKAWRGELDPVHSKQKRKIVFNTDLKLSGSRRKAIAREVIIDTKKNVSIMKLKCIIECWDFKTQGKITQRTMARIKGISKKTIEKYSKGFRELIDEKNADYKLKLGQA